MNEEKKFHKMIRNRDADNREKILERIKAECPQYFEEPQKEKKGRINKKMVAICCSVGAVAASVAVILPFALPRNDTPEQSDKLYSIESDYKIYSTEQTIKEYAEQVQKNILYFDWYDYIDICETESYLENGTQRVLSVKETLAYEDGSLEVILQFTEVNVYLAGLYNWNFLCINEYTTDSVSVKWTKDDYSVYGFFEYDDYRYYLTLNLSLDESRYFELLDELIGE